MRYCMIRVAPIQGSQSKTENPSAPVQPATPAVRHDEEQQCNRPLAAAAAAGCEFFKTRNCKTCPLCMNHTARCTGSRGDSEVNNNLPVASQADLAIHFSVHPVPFPTWHDPPLTLVTCEHGTVVSHY